MQQQQFCKSVPGHLSYLNVTAGMYITQKCGVTNAVRVKCDYIIYIIFRIHCENAYSSIVYKLPRAMAEVCLARRRHNDDDILLYIQNVIT